MAAALLCAAVGCTTSAPPNGTALVPGSNWRIALESIGGMGRGLATVCGLVKVRVAPAQGSGRKDVPGGAYETDPPVYWVRSGTCIKQPMVPLDGFRLAPGGLARV